MFLEALQVPAQVPIKNLKAAAAAASQYPETSRRKGSPTLPLVELQQRRDLLQVVTFLKQNLNTWQQFRKADWHQLLLLLLQEQCLDNRRAQDLLRL
jgi:hypothetical protein